MADPPPRQSPPWADPPPKQTTPPPHVDMTPGRHSPGQIPPGWTPLLGRPPGQTPPSPETATAADGTHPTRMHSCSSYVYYLPLQCFSYNINL